MFIKKYLLRLRLYLNKVWLNNFSSKYKESKNKIKLAGKSAVALSNSGSLKDKLFLFCTFRINSPLRQEILKTVVPVSLSGVANSDLDFWALDASPDEYVSGNKAVFQSTPGLNMGYYAKKVKQQEGFASVLKEATKPYFSTIYDDQPIVGLNPDFLSACCNLLEDFKGSVDLILIESPQSVKIDKENKKIIYDLDTLEFKSRKVEPLAVLKYGNYNFAIMHNYHYGFFFNTIIANAKVYAEKLKWYMQHVNSDNSQYIELAGMKRKGPVYDFIAVPLEAAMFNADVAHSDISIRAVDNEVKELYEALKAGYTFTSSK